MMRGSVLVLLFLSVVVFGCHTSSIPEPRPVDYVVGRIGGAWKVSKAELDGVNKTEYAGAAILFSASQSDDFVHYTTGNMPSGSPWAANGTFKLGNDINTDLIMVSPEVAMTYLVNGAQLEISFVYNGDPWKFTFTKQNGGGPAPSV